VEATQSTLSHWRCLTLIKVACVHKHVEIAKIVVVFNCRSRVENVMNRLSGSRGQVGNVIR